LAGRSREKQQRLEVDKARVDQGSGDDNRGKKESKEHRKWMRG